MLTVCVCSGGYPALARHVSLLSPRLLNGRYELASLSACTILTPIMASRLMLSLKKAAVEPRGPWSQATTPDFGRRGSPGDGTFCLVPPTLGGSYEHPEIPKNKEDIKLESMPRLPQSLKPSYG